MNSWNTVKYEWILIKIIICKQIHLLNNFSTPHQNWFWNNNNYINSYTFWFSPPLFPMAFTIINWRAFWWPPHRELKFCTHYYYYYYYYYFVVWNKTRQRKLIFFKVAKTKANISLILLSFNILLFNIFFFCSAWVHKMNKIYMQQRQATTYHLCV